MNRDYINYREINLNRISSVIAKLFPITGIVVFVWIVQGCRKEESSEKSMDGFCFEASKNPALDFDVRAVIRHDSILAQLPARTNMSALVATFSYTGTGVSVNHLTQTSGVHANNFSYPVQYVVKAEDHSTRTYTVKLQTASELKEFMIKKSLNPGLTEDIFFSINHHTGTVEGTHLKWIDSPSASRLVASFEAGDSEIRADGVVLSSGVTVIDFRKPVKISASGKAYTASILCPQINAGLPVLRINADGPITSKETYVTAKLEILGNGITEGLWDFNREKIEIRLRGNSTVGLPKKPYRIKFPEKCSPLGLKHAREKSWVLLANDCDKSLIRNAVAFQMSRLLAAGAVRFTPCTQFVDVYLNGAYDGNYHLTDQVEVAPGRVDVKSLKAGDAGNASKISGGYLLELDGFAHSEPLHFASPRQMPVTVQYPKNADYAPEQATYIANYFAATENALFSVNFKDPATGWRKYINQASWVDYYIISELTGNSDAWWSTYMSKERNVDYFVAGPVWDFDIAFNNDNRIGNATARLMAEAAHDPKTWINRFMQDETFKAAVKVRWNAKKGELLGLETYMDELAVLLDMSQKANFKRWNITQQVLGHANPAPTSYEAAISQLKSYFQARYHFLDTEFNKW